MRHRAKGRQLSRTAEHRKALLRNMATSLFTHEQIVTTEAKAKELRPYAERLITLARRGDLHARRQAEQKLRDRESLGRLFTRDRPAVREPARRLYPHPEARASPRRWRRSGADRVARRVTTTGVAVAEMKKGTQGSPFFQPARQRPGGPARAACRNYDAFLTRLLLRQRVQTRTRRGAPSTITRTVCRLGYHRRFVLLLAWLTLLPVAGPLVQTLQTRAMTRFLLSLPNSMPEQTRKLT